MISFTSNTIQIWQCLDTVGWIKLHHSFVLFFYHCDFKHAESRGEQE